MESKGKKHTKFGPISKGCPHSYILKLLPKSKPHSFNSPSSRLNLNILYYTMKVGTPSAIHKGSLPV